MNITSKKINLCVEILMLVLSNRTKRTIMCDKSPQFEGSYELIRFDMYRVIMVVFLSEREDTDQYLNLCDTIFSRLLKKIKS